MANSAITKEERMNWFFQKYGVTEVPTTDKERLELLKVIISLERVNLDVVDINYRKNQSKLSNDDFVKQVKEIENNIRDAQSYCEYVIASIKLEKKEKKKENFQKIKRIFMK